MRNFGAILRHPGDLYPLLKLKMAMKHAEEQSPPGPHWAFCYTMFYKISPSFAVLFSQHDPEIRKLICVYYLILRALDTIEDDNSLATDVKVPILIAFHRHIGDLDWHFSCGSTKEYRDLMDQFHHVSTAYLELEKSYQEEIEDTTKRMGAGMAKFICNETVCSHAPYFVQSDMANMFPRLFVLSLSKLYHASGLEELAPDSLSDSMGIFYQKSHIIEGYMEDINELPKPHMFWPFEIWGKYVNKLEDLKYEENSVRAVPCLNEMVTNALIHAEDCLKFMSALRYPAIFHHWAISQVRAFASLALCYNNIEVFRGGAKMRLGLKAKIIDRTNTMVDVYCFFFDFCCLLKSKVDKNDPNATKTLSRVEAIQKVCRDSGALSKRKSYIIQEERSYTPFLVIILFIILAFVLANRDPKLIYGWLP